MPEPITFFIDRSLGRRAGEMLRENGAHVVFHDELFAENATDVEWLAEVGAKQWVVITKDKRIRRRPLERQAVQVANLRVFVLASSKGQTGEQMGKTLVKNQKRMERLARHRQAPFIAGVYESAVRIYDLPDPEQ